MDHGSNEDDSMMPDPPMTAMKERMNRGHMPVPPQQVQEAMQKIAEMEQELEEMREDLMSQQNRR